MVIKRWCNICKSDQNENQFHKGKSECKACGSQRSKNYRKTPVGYANKLIASIRQRSKENNWETDVTPEFILALVEKPCLYCETTELRRTLDRIDNSKGYTQDNVNPCCTRCNEIRTNMPYEAWLVVAKYVKQAVQEGLFGDWTGTITGKPKPRDLNASV